VGVDRIAEHGRRDALPTATATVEDLRRVDAQERAPRISSVSALITNFMSP
jgi:hypothetical protein